jgi:hypothetical protein
MSITPPIELAQLDTKALYANCVIAEDIKFAASN